MAVKWFKTSFLGVRYREHATRKHGVRFDKCYSIRYKLNGKDKEEVVGWSSEGVTAEIAYKKLSELRENRKVGSGAKTLEEKRKLAQVEEAERARQEKLKAQNNINLISYWETIYKPYAQATKKVQSFRPEKNHMEKYILPVLSELEITSIDMHKWDLLIQSLSTQKKPLTGRTKEYITGTLRRVLKHAQDRGYDIRIPTGKQIGITGNHDNRRERIITPEESAQILKKLSELDICTLNLVKFAMYTGCRLSEATQLKWAHVNLREKQGKFINTKNKDTRLFFMSDELHELLSSLAHGKASDYVFLRNDSHPFFKHEHKSEVPHFFKVALKELGLNEGRDKLDRISFHSIRHTVATNLAKFLDVRSLMDVMGWKVVAMAARYIHTQEDTKRNAANALAQLWGEK